MDSFPVHLVLLFDLLVLSSMARSERFLLNSRKDDTIEVRRACYLFSEASYMLFLLKCYQTEVTKEYQHIH